MARYRRKALIQDLIHRVAIFPRQASIAASRCYATPWRARQHRRPSLEVHGVPTTASNVIRAKCLFVRVQRRIHRRDHRRNRHAGEESAEVGAVGDVLVVVGEQDQVAEEAEDAEEAEMNRRHGVGERPDFDIGHWPADGEADVAADQAGDRAGRADRRHRRIEIEGDVEDAAADAGDEEDGQRAPLTEQVGREDAERPEEHHVVDDVLGVAMEEHGGDERAVGLCFFEANVAGEDGVGRGADASGD